MWCNEDPESRMIINNKDKMNASKNPNTTQILN